MKFCNWLFIDHCDLLEDGKLDRWRADFPGCHIKGTRQKFDGWASIEYLSVLYTAVGSTILDRCPNLRWVYVRAHRYNFIDEYALRLRKIGLATSGENTAACARYLVRRVVKGPVLLCGYGRIGRAVAELLNTRGITYFVTDSKTGALVVRDYASRAATIISTIPPQKALFGGGASVFDSNFFECCRNIDFLSISDGSVIDNQGLLSAIREGFVRRVVADNLSGYVDDIQKLLETGVVEHTGHTAWKDGFSESGHRQYTLGVAARLRDASYQTDVLKF